MTETADPHTLPPMDILDMTRAFRFLVYVEDSSIFFCSIFVSVADAFSRLFPSFPVFLRLMYDVLGVLGWFRSSTGASCTLKYGVDSCNLLS